MNKAVAGIIGGTLLLLVGTVLLAGKMANSAKVEASPEAKVELGETAFDWGEIKLEEGNVEKEFEIKNIGSQVLKLFNVTTSCMCTTAQFLGGESPIFGMHGKSGYVEEVAPGGSTIIKVVFDPAYHGPSGVGPINRQVMLSSNDPNKPQINLMLTAMVIK